jgi:hypothetical protein
MEIKTGDWIGEVDMKTVYLGLLDGELQVIDMPETKFEMHVEIDKRLAKVIRVDSLAGTITFAMEDLDHG